MLRRRSFLSGILQYIEVLSGLPTKIVSYIFMTEFFTESKTDKKDELIQKLTEAEASRNQIQSDAKQMADELVAQYNRFQTEQDELKAALEKEHTEQLRQASEQFETEKNTLLENFGEKYQHLETENEGKISGMRF